jgi:hypothetical protein
MSAHAIDDARADLVHYAKALVANRIEEAIAIEKKYDLHGLPPELVSVGLHAAAEGRDALAAVDEHMEAED